MRRDATGMSNLLEPIVQAVVSLVGALGAPGVGVAVAAENLFPPIPSEVILPSAGFAAASGSMGLISARLQFFWDASFPSYGL